METNNPVFEKLKNFSKHYLSDSAYAVVASTYKLAHPHHNSVILMPKKSCWFKCDFTNGESGYSPTKGGRIPSYRFMNRLREKYSYEDFVEFKKNDTIVDVGGFNGSFAIMASSLSKEIFIIEPSPRNIISIKNNIKHLYNIKLFQNAIWAEDGMKKLKMGDDPTDDSLINIDKGVKKREKDVEVITIDSLIKNIDVDISFLKIDAEGAEPDILRGMNEYRPQKVAVDGSAECKGKETKEVVQSLLEDMGYTTRTGERRWEHMIYGRYD
jgi:FkbM family methyltransferase